VYRKKRRQNRVAGEAFSLRYFGFRSNAVLMKVTPDKELREHYPGRGGRDLPNVPKSHKELEERYALLWRYLDTHGVREEDRFFRPAYYIPEPSEKKVLYVYVPNDNRAITQFALQCRRGYGLHAYREGVGKELPPEVLEEWAS
jgi:hypothetical protein